MPNLPNPTCGKPAPLRAAAVARAIATFASCALPAAASAGCIAHAGVVPDTAIHAPLMTPVGGAACRGEDAGSTAVRMSLARVRAMAGLAPIDCDAAATAAATRHCEYVELNHEMSHVEVLGHLAFSGVNFWDRLSARGFTGDPSGEVLTNLAADQSIDDPHGLLNSVYHRAPFLRQENVTFGAGSRSACATIDFGRRKGSHVLSPARRVVWPPTGATNVPTTFISKNETPNPLPGTTTVGSPISLVTTDAQQIDATLTGPNGKVLATLITEASDPTHLVHAGEAHLVPVAPLAASTRYTARFTFRTQGAQGHSQGGEDGNVVVSMETTFTTGEN